MHRDLARSAPDPPLPGCRSRARRYRTIEIQAGDHTITAADPLPPDIHEALSLIHHDSAAH